MPQPLKLQALEGVPMIRPGDDLTSIIIDALAGNGMELGNGDILVLAQKIVSKAHDLFVDLKTVEPGERALVLAGQIDKDPRLVDVILSQSKSVIRQVPGLLITEHTSGWIMANAGIDASNVDAGDDERVLLLPHNPDEICQNLRTELANRTNVDVGVLINDSFGRPWRHGTSGIAIGAAGLPSLWDLRGETDLYGRELKVSLQGIGDELASAASLLQGQGAEGLPIVLISGLELGGDTPPPNRPAADLIREKERDLFR